VAIEVGQAEAAFPPQSEQVAEEDAAIASQNKWEDALPP
jgi:hypothetical protein